MLPAYPRFQRFIFSLGVVIILIPSFVLLGWQTDQSALKSWVTGANPMNPMTAVHFMLSGLWLVFTASLQRSLLPWIAVVITWFGFIHYITYFFPVDGLRLDYLLYDRKVRSSSVASLIAPNTALNFLCCGLAMLMSDGRNRKMQLFRQLVLVLSFLLVYISILGYVFNIQPSHRIGGLTPMSLISAISFLLLIPGLLFTNTSTGISATFASPLQGGRLVRIMVPFIIVFPPAAGYLRLLGEKRGWYPTEVGVELFTFIFMAALLFIIGFYASTSNKMQEAENKVITLMISLSEGVLQLDGKGLISFCNPAFEKILGYRKDELVGRSPIDTVVPAKDRQLFLKRLADRQEGIEEEYKNELITKEGKRIWLAIKSKPLQDEWGDFDGTLISVRDITDETLQFQDLQAFSASAAHDLNSPLANIQMMTGIIDQETMTGEQQELIGYISRETQRMRTLLDDLLTFSKMGSVAMPVNEVNLTEIVAEVSEPFKELPVQIIAGELPVITANLPAVRQLFTNLVSNAVKYSAKAKAPVARVQAYEKDDETWLVVSDNGIGIQKENLPEMFKPFKRFTDQFKGNGLGLAIVKRIVERHGGQIYAALNEEGGLSFHFTLSAEKRPEMKV